MIARYLDVPQEPAAIVHCKIGQGSAVLCGVHPEVNAEKMSNMKSLKD